MSFRVFASVLLALAPPPLSVFPPPDGEGGDGDGSLLPDLLSFSPLPDLLSPSPFPDLFDLVDFEDLDLLDFEEGAGVGIKVGIENSVGL